MLLEVMRMDVRVLYFDDCPNYQVVGARLGEALAAVGRGDTVVVYEKVDTPEQAEQRRFRGSPSVLIDGHDAFGDDDGPVGLSCRVYATEDGPSGSPSLAQLVSALRSVEPERVEVNRAGPDRAPSQ